ncbi:MAG: hypothetical protein ACSHWU_10165 [Marinicella sp.]
MPNINKKTILFLGLMATFAFLGLSNSQAAQATTCAEQNSHQTDVNTLVSYNFNDIDLSSVMMLAGNAANKEIIGLDLVAGKIISASAKEVNVTAFVDALLLVNGFNFSEQEENWIITKM